MSLFRTELSHNPDFKPVLRDDAVLFMGSCFAENLGEKLSTLKYDALVNSHGVIFNPISLFNLMHEVLENHQRPAEAFFFNDKLYRHFSGSSKLSAADCATTRQNFKQADSLLKKHLSSARYIFLTFGTAWVYRTKKDLLPVANCHKLPRDTFTKSLAEPAEMKRAYDRFHEKLREVNSHAQIIVTVSPVRHLRDGMIENNRSKARLIEFAHHCAENSPHTHYWPAYEYMMDDLRDYRFYKDDMVHPSKKAVDYIWDHFCDSFFTPQDKKLNRELNKIAFTQPLRVGSDQKKYHEKIKNAEIKYNVNLKKWRTDS